MATLQKIRSNKITQIAIGLGMLAFIAGSAVEILKSHQADTEVASLNGNSLDYAELNQMAEEYKEVLQTMGQLPAGEQVSNEIMAQIREQVYQSYVQQQLLDEECEKLGITVSDAELQNIIKNGQHPLLAQSPFRNQQGAFDYAQVQQFLKQRNEIMSNAQVGPEQREQVDRLYRLWCFIEKEVKNSTKMEKYQVLLGGLAMTNPISAKASFEGRTKTKDILLAALPYTSIEDKNVKVEDKEVEAKYNEYKEAFFQPAETRDIKYINVLIKASKADEEALNKEMAGYAEQMKAENAVIESIVRQSQSLVPYSTMPVSKSSLPADIASRIDSIAVGSQTEPYYNKADNSVNIIKLINKVSQPDSVEVRQLVAVNQDKEKAIATADSIIAVLQGGEEFDSIAKKLSQPATKQWITGQMYEGQTLEENNKKFIETALTAAKGSYNKIDFEGGVLIMQVTDSKNVVEKYDVAVIKRSIDFSNETANKYYNDLSSFIASNKTIADMEKNQKGDYAVLDGNNMDAMAQDIMGIADSREVIRWAFKNETKVGDVSDIMYCGKQREHLVVAALVATHPAGYADLSNTQLKEYVTNLVRQDKKAAQLQDKMKSAKNVKDVAAIAGAVQDTVKSISFSAPVYLQKMGAASEPALSGAVSAAAKGKFVSGVRGNAGVYAFEVLNENKSEDKYDEKAEMQLAAQQNFGMIRQMFNVDMRNPMSIFNKAYKKANIEDKRHLFY